MHRRNINFNISPNMANLPYSSSGTTHKRRSDLDCVFFLINLYCIWDASRDSRIRVGVPELSHEANIEMFQPVQI